jgi:hypothetical protein
MNASENIPIDVSCCKYFKVTAPLSWSVKTSDVLLHHFTAVVISQEYKVVIGHIPFFVTVNVVHDFLPHLDMVFLNPQMCKSNRYRIKTTISFAFHWKNLQFTIFRLLNYTYTNNNGVPQHPSLSHVAKDFHLQAAVSQEHHHH